MNMYPHRIRLRGPWDYEVIERRAGTGQTATMPQTQQSRGRMRLPCRWREGGLVDFAGRVRLERHFGRPRQLDDHERVWLTFAGLEGLAQITLNGQFLGESASATKPFEFEVTPLLQERNELVVDIEAADDGGGLWGEVALEIRCQAFLRAIELRIVSSGARMCLEVTGEVVGASEQPLEVYATLDRSTVGYAIVEADRVGKAFQLISDELEPEGTDRSHAVRVELVSAASVWYGVELALTFPPSVDKHSPGA